MVLAATDPVNPYGTVQTADELAAVEDVVADEPVEEFLRRARNLAIFGIGTLALAGAVIWTFRSQLAPLLGVNVDAGPGGRASGHVTPGKRVA